MKNPNSGKAVRKAGWQVLEIELPEFMRLRSDEAESSAALTPLHRSFASQRAVTAW